jgi:hypothetical protein
MGYSLAGKCAFFAVPYGVLDVEAFGDLSPAAIKLLVFIYACMNARSAPGVRVSLAQLADALRMDAKTLRAARKNLESAGAILCAGGKGGAAFEFRTVNPKTREPFPPENGRPEIADYKPRRTKAALTATPDAAPVPVAPTVFEVRPMLTEPAPASTAPRPADVKAIQRVKPPQSAAVQKDEMSHEGQRVCYMHGNRDMWQLADGTPRCNICHPNPNASTPVRSSQAVAQLDLAGGPDTEHGLRLTF